MNVELELKCVKFNSIEFLFYIHNNKLVFMKFKGNTINPFTACFYI